MCMSNFLILEANKNEIHEVEIKRGWTLLVEETMQADDLNQIGLMLDD
jgi:hypothetical protein